MAGLAKQKVYQYAKDGSFITEYSCIADALRKYGRTKGAFFSDKEYRKMDDGTYMCKTRIGRHEVIKIDRIENCPYCTRKDKRQKEIEVYNLLGDKIAEFSSLAIAEKMTGIDKATIFCRLNSNTGYLAKSENNLIFKYKK